MRRLYVDACLIAAVDAWLAHNPARAEEACRQVFEYPENLGAASYLGEHSRMARYLLGVFADSAGRAEEAERWWRDVLSRSSGTVTYSVGEEDAQHIGRLDERLALVLAHARLNGTRPEDTTDTTQDDDTPAAAANTVCQALARGDADTLSIAAAASRRFPCDPLIRILTQVAHVESRLPRQTPEADA